MQLVSKYFYLDKDVILKINFGLLKDEEESLASAGGGAGGGGPPKSLPSFPRRLLDHSGLSDGVALAAVVAHYRPDRLTWRDLVLRKNATYKREENSHDHTWAGGEGEGGIPIS